MKKITLVNNEIVVSDVFPSANGEVYVLSDTKSGCMNCPFSIDTPLGRICDYMPKRAIELCNSGKAIWKIKYKRLDSKKESIGISIMKQMAHKCANNAVEKDFLKELWHQLPTMFAKKKLFVKTA